MTRSNTCSAINCMNSRTKISNLSMFRVPKDPVRSKEWITNSGRSELLLKDPNYLYDNIIFCAAHFEDSQFTNTNKNRLVWNAVPTLFCKDTGLGQTKSAIPVTTFCQPSVNCVRPKPATKSITNPTFKSSRNLCLPQKYVKIALKPKPIILKSKSKAFVDKCQSSKCLKQIELKSTTNQTDKLIQKKLVYNKNELLFLNEQDPKNNSSILSQNKTNIESLKRKLIISSKKLLNKTIKPRPIIIRPIKWKFVSLKENESYSSSKDINKTGMAKSVAEVDKEKYEEQSSVNCIEPKGVTHLIDQINVGQIENNGQSLVNQITTRGTTNITDEHFKEEKIVQTSENVIKTKLTHKIHIKTAEGMSQATRNTTNKVALEVNSTRNTTKITNHKVNMEENKSQSPASQIKTSGINKRNDEVSKLKNQGQSSANSFEIEVISNPADELVIKENKNQSLENQIKFKETTNPSDDICKGNNEGQSSANCIEIDFTINHTDEVDRGEHGDKYPTNKIVIKGSSSDEVMEESVGQSSVNCIETYITMNPIDEVNIQEYENQYPINQMGTKVAVNNKVIQENIDQLSVNCIRTKVIKTSTTDKVYIVEKEDQSPANKCKAIDNTNPTDEVTRDKNGNQFSANPIEAKVITNPTDQEDIKENDDQSLANSIKSMVTVNTSDVVDKGLGKNECQFLEIHVENENNEIKNPSNEIDKTTQINSNPLAVKHNSSILLSSAKHMNTKKISNSTSKALIHSRPQENKLIILNHKLPRNKLKSKVLNRKLCAGLLRSNSGKRVVKSLIPRKKFEALKEKKCKSPAKLVETKVKTNPNHKVDSQEKSSPTIIECFSLVKRNTTKVITNHTDQRNNVKSSPEKIGRPSSHLLSIVKQNGKSKVPDPIEKEQNLSALSEGDSSLLNDEFFQYRKRVEAFKRKLLSPDYMKPENKRKCKALGEQQCQCPVKVYESKHALNSTCEVEIQPDSQKSECQSSVSHVEMKEMTNGSYGGNQLKISQLKNKCLSSILLSSVKQTETKSILNPSDKMKIKSTIPENSTLITKVDFKKYNEKIEAFEKIIKKSKAEHKSEVRKLKKIIKDYRRRIRRKAFLITKLRKEKNDLKNCRYFVKSTSKPNFRRDRHFIEQTLSKYMSHDTLQIVMSQLRNPTTSYGNRWTDEVKIFALNIMQASPKAYKVLSSYLHLPSIRTLQKFFQGDDLMSLSGLNYNIYSDIEKFSEDITLPDESSVVNIYNEDMTDSGMISSIVEVDYGVSTDSGIISSVIEVETDDQLKVESLNPQVSEKESGDTAETENIIYIVTGTEKECEVIIEEEIPAEGSVPWCPDSFDLKTE